MEAGLRTRRIQDVDRSWSLYVKAYKRSPRWRFCEPARTDEPWSLNPHTPHTPPTPPPPPFPLTCSFTLAEDKDVANEDDNLLVAPNTLTSALKPSSEARVITEATRPFRITHVNDAWVSLCGFTASEACGQTLRCLQGKETNPETVAQLVEDCNELKPTSMEVTNYDKEGRTFRNFLQVSVVVCVCEYDDR